MTAKISFLSATDVPISLMDMGEFAAGVTGTAFTFKLKNTGDAATTDLSLGVATGWWNYDGDGPGQGQEAVTEQWLEAKVGAGPWTPIGGDPLVGANVLALANLGPGDSVTIQLRINVPGDAALLGNLAVIPFAFYDGEAP